MDLESIMLEIAEVENGLAFGEINFTFDKLMSAIKPGHPADMLDDIFSPVGNEVYFHGETNITKEALVELLNNLKDFKNCFKVKELNKPIKHLKEYIDEKYGEKK